MTELFFDTHLVQFYAWCGNLYTLCHTLVGAGADDDEDDQRKTTKRTPMPKPQPVVNSFAGSKYALLVLRQRCSLLQCLVSSLCICFIGRSCSPAHLYSFALGAAIIQRLRGALLLPCHWLDSVWIECLAEICTQLRFIALLCCLCTQATIRCPCWRSNQSTTTSRSGVSSVQRLCLLHIFVQQTARHHGLFVSA